MICMGEERTKQVSATVVKMVDDKFREDVANHVSKKEYGVAMTAAQLAWISLGDQEKRAALATADAMRRHSLSEDDADLHFEQAIAAMRGERVG